MKLIKSFITGAGELLNGILVGLTDKIFYAEKEFSQAIGSSNLMDFSKVNKLFLDFAISLIILKFLKKGFDIYVGWYDGDKDSDPTSLFTNFIRAIVTAVSFSFLYDILAKVVIDFMDKSLLSLLSVNDTSNLLDTLLNLMGGQFFWGIGILILVICYIILWIKFFVLGIEMFMLRLGFPIACIGLIDSDKGMFSPYLKKIFIICATAVVQIFLLRLSLMMVFKGHVIWGIAFCFASMKTPKSLQEFMFAYGSGGGINSAISTGHHVTSLVRILSKVKGG